ncbi:MAG: hypothetical protein R2715_04150 [Ilumatobacteraceae bacterium]
MQGEGRTIWRRDTDDEGSRRRMRLFVRWYVIPLVVILVVVAVASDPWNALGVLILFGSIGALLWFWIWGTGRNRRTNPEVAFDGTSLMWGRLAVPVAQVERYTTYRSSSTIHIDATTWDRPLRRGRVLDDRGQAGRVPLGGSVRRRPRLLRVALDTVLPGRYVVHASEASG